MIAARWAGLLLLCGLLAFGGYGLFQRAEAPASSIFGPTVVSGPPGRKMVALTYDDGPNPPYTSRILDVLERHHAHATFFVVGRAAARYPTLLQRMRDDGDAIGNHSWDHAHLILKTKAELADDVSRTSDVVARVTGTRPTLLRPPFGQRSWTLMREVAALGYSVVMWSVPLAGDWEQPGAQVIAERILAGVSDGAILVLHDGNRGLLCPPVSAGTCDRTQDVAATDTILTRLERQGYRFVTIPELLGKDASLTHSAAR